MSRYRRKVVLHGGALGKDIVNLTALCGGGQIDTADQRNFGVVAADKLFCQFCYPVLQPDHLADKAEQLAALTVIHPVQHHLRQGRVKPCDPFFPEGGEFADHVVRVVTGKGHAENRFLLSHIQ